MVGPVNRGFGPMEQGQKSPTASKAESGATGVVESVKEKAQDLASGVASAAGEAWDSTREGVERAYSAVANTAGDAFGEVTDFMRRYPLATLLIGFGMGFLAAQAFRFSQGQTRYGG
jgi:ElaB/YqjD/DUF883 family membrane-anchored ribosome-binding protein